MKKISVIVPVFNAKKYLEKCLDSITNQTYSELEIICVDDGSNDGSEKILDKYSAQDTRICVIHQENQGESCARNRGLRVASGEFLTFVDCDDWIAPDMYEKMVWAMKVDSLDMVCTGWFKDTEEKSVDIKNAEYVGEAVFGRDELLKYIYQRDLYRGFAYIWNKMYKRDLIFKGDGSFIAFNEKLKLGGDVQFLAEVALKVRRCKYIDFAFYHYVQRETSGCHTKNVINLMDWLHAYENVIDLLQRENVDGLVVDYVRRFAAYHSSNFAEKAYDTNDIESYEYFQKYMHKYKKKYLELNNKYPDRISRYLEILNRNEVTNYKQSRGF